MFVDVKCLAYSDTFHTPLCYQHVATSPTSKSLQHPVTALRKEVHDTRRLDTQLPPSYIVAATRKKCFPGLVDRCFSILPSFNGDAKFALLFSKPSKASRGRNNPGVLGSVLMPWSFRTFPSHLVSPPASIRILVMVQVEKHKQKKRNRRRKKKCEESRRRARTGGRANSPPMQVGIFM